MPEKKERNGDTGDKENQESGAKEQEIKAWFDKCSW